MLAKNSKMLSSIAAMLLIFVGLNLFGLANGALVYAMPCIATGALLFGLGACGASIQFVRISKRGVQTDAG